MNNMQDIQHLRDLQVEFESKLKELSDYYNRLEVLRNEFVKKFPVESLSSLPLENYVIGEVGKKDSFCYWVENRLQDLGNIHGASAFKFGIYFGVVKNDKEKKYRFSKHFGTNEMQAYNEVRNELVSLLLAAKSNDLPFIKENKLSPMFKGKVLSLYFPDQYLNVFSSEHLSHFLEILGIPYTRRDDEVDKREKLRLYKDQDEVLRVWKLPMFGHFLYRYFKPVIKKDVSEPLRQFVDEKYIPVSDVKYIMVDWKSVPLPEVKDKDTIHKKVDFDELGRRNRYIGNRGELLAMRVEVDRLKKENRKDLAEKVRLVSRETDNAGYDLLSYYPDGREKFVEVKSSTGINALFYMSRNELDFAENHDNYEIILILEVTSAIPKVKIIKRNDLIPSDAVRKTAMTYKFELGME